MASANSKLATTGNLFVLLRAARPASAESFRSMCSSAATMRHDLIVRATESLNPPHRLLLGNDAYEVATAKLEDLRKKFSPR